LTRTAGSDTLEVMSSDAERIAIDHVAQRLSARFPTVDPVVHEAHRRFQAHPTREFVPILVEGTARDTLRVLPATSRDRRQ
jgi:hypothetical protein